MTKEQKQDLETLAREAAESWQNNIIGKLRRNQKKFYQTCSLPVELMIAIICPGPKKIIISIQKFNRSFPVKNGILEEKLFLKC